MTGSPTTVRRAVPADLDTVLDLVAEYCAADDHPFDAATARTGVTPLLDDDRVGAVWLIDDDGVIDGYAAVTWGWSIESGGADAILDELYVRTKGRGHGSELIRHVEDDCRRRGVRRVFLETERANGAARRLYRRHGYVAEPSIWMAKTL